MTLVNLSRRAPAELPDGAYDVRGWEVRTALDEKKVGKVDDMLLDERGSPRYLDVDLGMLKKHVLVPLEEAHAEASEQVVWIDRLDQERLSRVPEYDHDPAHLSSDYERRLLDEYRTLSRGDGGEGDGRRRVHGTELARLGDLDDFRIAKGVTDPRGWKVLGGDGNKIGEVSELIVDADALSTRYMDVRVDEKGIGLEPLDRHVLVPVDRVRLDRKAKHVVVDGLFAGDMKDHPLYQGLPLDQETQRTLDRAYGRGSDRDGDGRRDPATVRFFGPRNRPGDREPRAAPRRTPPAGAQRLDLEATGPEGSGDRSVVAGDGDEVRIRVSGDDIVIEKHSRRRGDG